MKHTIAIIAGTRPEAIKMAPVYFALKESDTLKPVFLSTAQHRQMLDMTLASFGIVPEYDLNLMQPGQTLSDLTVRVLSAVSNWLGVHRPSAVLLQGDTTTVLASAMASFYQKIPFGHIEAGLRTGDMLSPFPEEMNRRLTSPIAKWHFCPTENSRVNLQREQIINDVYVTGNTVVDALLWTRKRLTEKKHSSSDVAGRLGISKSFHDRYLASHQRPWILVTGHRRESFGDGFERICESILSLAHEYQDLGVLYPVHLNPQVREPVNRILGAVANVELVEPAGYEDFVWLMDRSYFILSDSGGVQEEAPSLGKPVLVLREHTERPEGVTAGTCTLVGTDVERILAKARELLDDPEEYQRRSQLSNPYGDGTAALQIREILERHFSAFGS
jgi:UDP-N-acetylglucosamine 2-epimerase (non-hydrolysing)